MQPGQISVQDVGRRFRVNRHRNLTLKEAILRPEMRRTEEIWALRGVSFGIEPGESVGFVGRNGSGKTTLLRLIAGDLEPSEGTVTHSGGLGVMRKFIGSVRDATTVREMMGYHLELDTGCCQKFLGKCTLFHRSTGIRSGGIMMRANINPLAMGSRPYRSASSCRCDRSEIKGPISGTEE